MQALSGTYRSAYNVDICGLAEVIKAHRERPFIVVGSGGSFSLAALIQQLHETINFQLSKAVTPLQLYDLPIPIIEKSVILFVSAGGSNPDIISAFEFGSRHTAKLVAVTLSPGSELDKMAGSSGNTAITFDSPAGKDGFLATNSLMFMAIVFVRAFAAATGKIMSLPAELDVFLHGINSMTDSQNNLAELVQKLSGRTNLITLYSPALFPAIADLESKLAESGLGAVLPADWRNFAHGRHHWLAKRETEAGIVAFWTERDRSIAERTLKLLPETIPVAPFEVSGDYPEATLRAFFLVLKIVGELGKAQGIDPGRPGVPIFGRKIYHLKYQPTLITKKTDKASCKKAAIERKFRALAIKDREPNYEVVGAAFETFVEKLSNSNIGGLVLDYDGTICGAANRFGNLRQDIVQALSSIAEAGLHIGIATGRGKSVGVALRTGLAESAWKNVVIGYYNGGAILPLSQELSVENEFPADELTKFKELILSELPWSEWVPIETRPSQISILTNSSEQQSTVFRQLQHLQFANDFSNLRLVYSTHSIDVIAPSVSKLNLVNHLKKQLSSQAKSVLCIGDLGMYPGNDFELLSTECSLSVDEVSPDLKSCWNMLPPLITGEDGVLCYLKCLELDNSKPRARFVAESLIDCRKSSRSVR